MNVGSFSRFVFPLIRKSYPALIANQLVGVQPMTPTVKDFGIFKLKIDRQRYNIAVSLLEKYDYSNPSNDILVEAHFGAWFWKVNVSRGCVQCVSKFINGPNKKVLSVAERRELVAGCRKALRKLHDKD
jgi:hypothetical protein